MRCSSGVDACVVSFKAHVDAQLENILQTCTANKYQSLSAKVVTKYIQSIDEINRHDVRLICQFLSDLRCDKYPSHGVLGMTIFKLLFHKNVQTKFPEDFVHIYPVLSGALAYQWKFDKRGPTGLNQQAFLEKWSDMTKLIVDGDAVKAVITIHKKARWTSIMPAVLKVSNPQDPLCDSMYGWMRPEAYCDFLEDQCRANLMRYNSVYLDANLVKGAVDQSLTTGKDYKMLDIATAARTTDMDVPSPYCLRIRCALAHARAVN